ncbi:hypothetical protein AKJ16_DCAP00179 [Drosera capensis]
MIVLHSFLLLSHPLSRLLAFLLINGGGREITGRGGATESGEIPNRSGDHDDRSRVAPWIHHVPQQKDTFFFVVVGVVLQTHEQRLDIGEMTKQLICCLAGWMDE